MSKWLLIIEPIVVLLVIGFAAKLLLSFAGIESAALETALFSGDTGPDWLEATWLEGIWQGLRWGLLLAAAVILARRRAFSLWAPFDDRSRPLAARRKVLLGLAAGATLLPLATIPRWYHYSVESIGQVPPIWDVIYASDWTPSFWLFMAVASFALIPLVEELFFRGYVLGSLARRFSPAAAIFLSALIFMVVHLRYAQLDAFALFNWISVFLFSAAAAWMVYRTNSLLPAISMHVYVNLPRPLSWSLYELVLVLPAAYFLYEIGREVDGAGGNSVAYSDTE